MTETERMSLAAKSPIFRRVSDRHDGMVTVAVRDNTPYDWFKFYRKQDAVPLRDIRRIRNSAARFMVRLAEAGGRCRTARFVAEHYVYTNRALKLAEKLVNCGYLSVPEPGVIEISANGYLALNRYRIEVPCKTANDSPSPSPKHSPGIPTVEGKTSTTSGSPSMSNPAPPAPSSRKAMSAVRRL